jgi:diguanylate cyclase (GGDEF)-like protein/PAS domain S-box-containing protein
LLEGALLVLASVVASFILFFTPHSLIDNSMLQAYLLLPVIIWVSLRFNKRYVLSLLNLVAVIALVGTQNGLGQFAVPAQSVSERMLTLQIFLGVMVFSAFLINTILVERKRAGQVIQNSEVLLNEIQSLAGVGGWEYDITTRAMVWTREVYRIHGVTNEHDPGDVLRMVSFYATQDQQSFSEAFQNAIKNGEAFDLELGFINAQGQYRWVRTRGHPLFENGQVTKVIGSMMDITAGKMAEAALLQAYKKLELQVETNEELQALLLEQATHDALTSLYNRRFMDDTLNHELARASRENYPVSVMMLDIDHFKEFNDTHGHEAGDLVLPALSKVLLSNIRESDYACRYGGDEFVVILPRADLQQALTRAEAIRRIFAGQLISAEGFQLSATISVGIADYPTHATCDDLLRAADNAMYLAKQAGRNRVSMVDGYNLVQGAIRPC